MSEHRDFPGPHERNADGKPQRDADGEPKPPRPQPETHRETAGGKPGQPPLPEEVLQRWADLTTDESGARESSASERSSRAQRCVAPGWVPFGILLATLLLLGAATFIVHRDLVAANQALTATANTLAAASGPAGPAEARKLALDIDQGNYTQVVQTLQQMAGRLARRPVAAPGAPPAELPNIPPNLFQELGPEASQFFNDHPRLLRRLLALAAGARELEAKGVNVDALRPIRDRAIKAAAAGDEAAVEKLANDFEARLRDLGGTPRPVPPLPGEKRTRPRKSPEQLVAKARQLEATLKKAASEGKDISQAVRLARRAEQAADAGDMRLAESLLDAAMRAAERAPRMAGPRFARRRVPMGSGPGRRQGPFPATVLDSILAMLRAEETDLASTYEAIENAQGAVREANQEQINQMLEEAKQTLRRIAHRRNQVSLALGGRRRPHREGAGAAGARETAPSGVTAPMAPLPERLIAFLENVRKMPEAEFQAVKKDLAGVVFAMFLPPPPKPGAPKVDEEQAERVKQKLRLAAGPYMQRKLAGQDTSELDALLRETRAAIYRGDIETADKLIDEALQQLGLLPSGPAPEPTPQQPPQEGPPAAE